MATWTVGIDLGICGPHVATVMNENGDRVGSPLRFRLAPDDFDRLIRRVRDCLEPSDQVLVVMEPTGMAWFPVAHRLARAGWTVIRVKGQRVKALRRYLSAHAKTDVVDSQILGAMPRYGRKGLQPVYLPSSQQHALKRLTHQWRRYQSDICSIRRRLQSLVRWSHPSLEEVLPPLKSGVSLAVLDRYFKPQAMRRLGRARLTAFIRKHAAGRHPRHGSFAEELAVRLLEAARATMALYPHDEVDFDLLQFEIRQEIQRLKQYKEHVHQLGKEIDRLYSVLHPDDHLRTIPGLGEFLAPAMLGEIQTWKRFGAQKRFRGYCGLYPRRNESGGQDSPSQKITKAAKGSLKRDLTLAAEAARRIDPELARVYYTMMVVKGKHHRQAVCAVVTHLVDRIFAVLKEGRPYVIRDLEGRSITPPEGREIINDHLTVPAAVRRSRRKQDRSTELAA